MSYVSLEDFAPGPRHDGTTWTQARIEESPAADGPWSVLETINLATGPHVEPIGLDPVPSEPQSRDFSTSAATLDSGWYRIVWLDAGANEQASDSVFSDAQASPYTSVTAVRMVLSPDGSSDPTLGTAASLSGEELQAAIQEGADEINARVGGRYTLPFARPVPPLLEKLNRDIAAYLATLVYRRNTPLPDNDPIRLRYQRAQDLLKDIQNGKIELVTQTAESVADSAEATVVNPYWGDLFTLEDFSLAAGRVRMPWQMP